MFYYYLLPNFIEKLLKECNNNGNMALYGVFLELYYKRNLFYISFLSLFFNIRIGLIFIFITFCLFLQSYMKWKNIIYKYII